MVIHKRTRLTPIQREEIYRVYHGEGEKVSDLAEGYHVSRPTIYKIIQRGRQQDFSIHRSTIKRFCCLKYRIKRLSKIEKEIEALFKEQGQALQQGLSRPDAAQRYKKVAIAQGRIGLREARISVCCHR
jgi:transposase-like protein